MNADQYNHAKANFENVFAKYEIYLSEESRMHVVSLLEAAEVEMAYESFVLSAIDEKINVSEYDRIELKRIGLLVNANVETVFKDDFWNFVGSWWGFKI